MPDGKKLEWGFCSVKYDCTGGLPKSAAAMASAVKAATSTALSASDFRQQYTTKIGAHGYPSVHPLCVDATNAQMEKAFGRKGASCAEFQTAGNCAKGIQGPDGKGVLLCCKSCLSQKGNAKKGSSKTKASAALARLAGTVSHYLTTTVLSVTSYTQQYTISRPALPACIDRPAWQMEQAFGRKVRTPLLS